MSEKNNIRILRFFKNGIPSDVSNVYIYVADAVRWDGLPSRIEKRGKSVKTIAASIHSPASFASLVTGRYLPHHGVTDFESRVPTSMSTIFDYGSYFTTFLNTLGKADGGDPIYSVLGRERELSEPFFSNVDTPFVVMERGQGGHAPYGKYDSITAAEYFEKRRTASLEIIQNEYYEAIERDADHFLQRLSSLRSEGLLNNTLVIYTSDHGELLGEGGMFGHNGLVRPELVYVPTVFISPETNQERVHRIFGHTDIFQILERVLTTDHASSESLQYSQAGRRYSFYRNRFDTPLGEMCLQYDSVWNNHGGTVRTNSGPLTRGVGAIDDLFDSQQRYLARRTDTFPTLLWSYWKKNCTFGLPDFDFDVEEELELVKNNSTSNIGRSINLDDTTEERLCELGYQ